MFLVLYENIICKLGKKIFQNYYAKLIIFLDINTYDLINVTINTNF